ncbi:HNH endonuclease signature motif containing protein [Demequina sp. NBRC 110056]|uniref:HNH endonuclease n=1 Tax=Demequina sp. NBRC 110056 TaxID=1570345 RepID=UPI0009FDF54F|nr:HNH endonuclease signature motif containing protein [Demequina sp. NBRC 110056]
MTFTEADWKQLHELLAGAAREDVSALAKAELLDRLETVGQISRTVGALEARYAGEIARRTDPDLPGGGLARVEGHGDAPTMFSKIQGGSVGRARWSVDAGDAFTPVEDDSPEPAPGEPGVQPGSDTEAAGEPGVLPGLEAEPPVPVPPVKRTRNKYPLVAGAQVAGDLAVEAAAAIVNGLNQLAGRVSAETLVELETRFVNKARGMQVNLVKRMVARAIARIDVEEHQERERVNHDKRYVWWKQDHTGMVVFHGELDAVTAAPILTVLEQMTTLQVRKQSRPGTPGQVDPDTGAITEVCGCQVNHARHDCDGPGACLEGHCEGCTGEPVEHRTIGQIRADALHDLARHALGCSNTHRSGVRTTIVVRMSLADLMGGVGLAKIDGITTPVSVREARRLAGDAGFIPEVLAGDGTVLELGRTQRRFSAAQRLAMLERDGGCAKCHAPPEYCEAHHIQFWEDGGLTDLDNGVMLCTRCHHDIHRLGWRITINGRHVTFTPPSNLDPDRTPHPGGESVFDVDLTGIHTLNQFIDPPVPPEDEAFIRSLPHQGAEPDLITDDQLAEIIAEWDATQHATDTRELITTP